MQRAQKKGSGKAWMEFGTCIWSANHPNSELAFREAFKKEPGKYEAHAFSLLADLHYKLSNFSTCLRFAELAFSHTLQGESYFRALKHRGLCGLPLGDRMQDSIPFLEKFFQAGGVDYVQVGTAVLQFAPEYYALGRQWLLSGVTESANSHSLYSVGSTLMLMGNNETDDYVQQLFFQSQSAALDHRKIIRDWAHAHVEEVDHDEDAYSRSMPDGRTLKYFGRNVSHIIVSDAILQGRYGSIQDAQGRHYLTHYDFLLPLELQDEGVQEFGWQGIGNLDGAFTSVIFFCENYGDFLLNGLTRLIYLRQLDNRLKIIICARGAIERVVYQALDILGISSDRVVKYIGHGKSLHISSLHVIDWTPKQRNLGLGAPHLPPRVALMRARSLFGQVSKTQDKLVFAKRLANRRMPMMEAWLQEVTPSWLKLVVYETAPLSQTIRTFGTCLVLVGAHGSGLANALFMPPGTHLVEIALQQGHAIYFEHLATALGLDYWRVASRGHGHLYSNELVVEREDVEAVLEQIFSRRPGAESDTVGGAGRGARRAPPERVGHGTRSDLEL